MNQGRMEQMAANNGVGNGYLSNHNHNHSNNNNNSNSKNSSSNHYHNNNNSQGRCEATSVSTKNLSCKDGKNRPLKITAVGDGMVGKTCMLITYTSQEFPTEYIPTVFDNFADVITVDGTEYNVTLWDTAGQEDYERLRPLSYPNTDCFLLCYSVSSKSSFDNIISKWYPELKHFCPNVPIIIVATKCDLRGTSTEAITLNEGKKMKQKIRALKHMECSALKNHGLNEIFVESVKCAIKKPRCKARNCKLL